MSRPAVNISLGLVGMMCIPVALSFFFFMQQSLRLDEAQSLWQTSRGIHDIFTLIAGDVHVPLYHVLLHFWMLMFGNSIPVARMMSLVFYLLSIPALYLLGKLAYNRTVGLFAAFLFALSPFMNWYGNEIRMYTLFTLLVILNQYFFIRIFKDPRTSAERFGSAANDHAWVGYILTALLGIFTHYFFFLNLASQVVYYYLRRDLFPAGSLWRFGFAAALIAVTFAPWVWYVSFIGQSGFESPVLQLPTTINLFSVFSQFLFGFQSDNLNTFFLSLWPVTVIFGLFTLQRSKRAQPESEYLLTTILVSCALAFVGSFIIAPIFVSRYLIFTAPSLYLLLASLFSNYSPHFARTLKYALAGLMLVTLSIEISNPTTPVKENYEAAVAYLNQQTTPQDIIVVSAPFTIYPVQYYYRGPSPIRTLPIWDQYAHGPIPAFSESSLNEEVPRVTDSSQNVYLLLSYDQGYENSIKKYFDTNYHQLNNKHFSDNLNLYTYKLRYDTTRSAATTTAIL